MAVVVDAEDNVTVVGIVTLEDIVEELIQVCLSLFSFWSPSLFLFLYFLSHLSPRCHFFFFSWPNHESSNWLIEYFYWSIVYVGWYLGWDGWSHGRCRQDQQSGGGHSQLDGPIERDGFLLAHFVHPLRDCSWTSQRRSPWWHCGSLRVFPEELPTTCCIFEYCTWSVELFVGWESSTGAKKQIKIQ